MTTNRPNGSWLAQLEALGPCPEVLKWARTQPDPQTAWEHCRRGDWMLWLVGRLSGPPDSQSRRRVVRAALACARLAPPCFDAEAERVRQECLRTTTEYVGRLATLEQVKVVETKASSYAATCVPTVEDYTDPGAFDGFYAAKTTCSNVTAAACAARVAFADVATGHAYATEVTYTVADSAAAAAYAANAECPIDDIIALRWESLAKCADAVRRVYPRAPRLPKVEVNP